MPDEHAKYPPSSLEYWELCPHFKNKPGDPEDTRVGDLVHKAVETVDASLVEGNEEAEWMYAGCVARVNNLQNLAYEGAHEARCTSHREDCWGTLDVLALSEDSRTAYVLDFKCGRVPVTEAAVNAQTSAYASFALNQFPEADEVIVEIYFARENQSTFATFKREDLPKMQLRIDRTIENIGKGPKNVTYNCRNCAHFLSCDEVQKQVVPTTKNSVSLGYLADPENLETPEDIVKALEANEVIGPWYENWEKEVKKRALKMAEICDLPGYEVRKRKGKASCKTTLDESAGLCLRLAEALPGLYPGDLAVSLSPSEIETAAVKAALEEVGLESARSKDGKAIREEMSKNARALWEDGTFTRGESTKYLKKVTKQISQSEKIESNKSK